MASAKDFKRKIHSISNTRKITRTMEMVSAAKSKQTQSRVEANTPYSRKLAELLESLSAAGGARHWLLEEPEGVHRNALLVVTANRGLCGGYNANALLKAERWAEDERRKGRETDVSMIGKKGIARFRFKRIPLLAEYTHISDRPSFREAEDLARGFMERFRRREVGQVWALSTRYFSSVAQRPVVTQLLPIIPPESHEARPEGAARARRQADFIFEPDPKTILESLLPFSVSQLVYRLLIEAAASEQIARRMAMKLATDNADELIKTYTRKYNRQRQAGITQQIMEVVGGAEALQ